MIHDLIKNKLIILKARSLKNSGVQFTYPVSQTITMHFKGIRAKSFKPQYSFIKLTTLRHLHIDYDISKEKCAPS